MFIWLVNAIYILYGTWKLMRCEKQLKSVYVSHTHSLTHTESMSYNVFY